MTLVFSPTQALLAAKAGAPFVSPFVGRLDDISTPGMELVADIVQIFENYDFDCEVLARASATRCTWWRPRRSGRTSAPCP